MIDAYCLNLKLLPSLADTLIVSYKESHLETVTLFKHEVLINRLPVNAEKYSDRSSNIRTEPSEVHTKN